MSEITLLHGDCLELMKQIPDKSIDMVCVDLPYGVTANKKDIRLPFDKLWEQYERIIKPNSVCAFFAQSVFYVDLVNSNRKMFRYDLVWDKVLKTGFLNAKRMPMRQHEQIAIFYKNSPVYNPLMEQGKLCHSRGYSYMNKEVIHRNYGSYFPSEDSRKNCTEKYPSSILKFSKPHSSIALHSTEKSVDLIEYLIKTYTNEGATVLDNCMGSGTTGVACKRSEETSSGLSLMKNILT